MTILTYNKMQHGNGTFLAENFPLRIKYHIKKQICDTCLHKHKPEKTNMRRMTFQ